MQRKSVHRGIVALAIVTSLTVAGSRPAAAADLGFLDRLDQLWSVLVGSLGSPSPVPHQVPGRSHHAPGKATSTAPSDRGFGIDPNGHSLTTDPAIPSGNG